MKHIHASKPCSFSLEKNPIAQMMAGLTGFAVAVTLILVTAIPVKADRKADSCHNAAPCALLLD